MLCLELFCFNIYFFTEFKLQSLKDPKIKVVRFILFFISYLSVY